MLGSSFFGKNIDNEKAIINNNEDIPIIITLLPNLSIKYPRKGLDTIEIIHVTV
jgi:hypothetical protein